MSEAKLFSNAVAMVKFLFWQSFKALLIMLFLVLLSELWVWTQEFVETPVENALCKKEVSAQK